MKSLKVIIPMAVVLVLVGGFFLIRGLTNHTEDFRDALNSGDRDAIEQLLKAHPSLVNANDMGDGSPRTEGWTALHIAANRNDAQLVNLLVRYHAKVDARDKHGLTPLLWTAFNGGHDAAAALLSAGADINARGADGRSTLDLAKLSLDNNMIELLRQRGAKE